MKKKEATNRRGFIKKSILGLMGAGFLSRKGFSHPEEAATQNFPKIKSYRTLGRTGFKVSDIGAGDFDDPGPFRALLDAGVNYIDTSENYGQHARKIGEVIKGRDRSSLFITSKLRANSSIRSIGKSCITKEGFLRRTNRVLKALGTDYLDCLMISCPETVEMLLCEGFHAAAAQLKKEGKIRFVGVSHHGSQWITQPRESMEKVLTAAAKDGRFDVMLLAYNFLQEDMSERILQVCEQENIGTTLMKTNPVRTYKYFQEMLEKHRNSKDRKLKQEETEGFNRYKKKVENARDFIKRYNLKSDKQIRDAAMLFVLSNPNVHTVCTTVLNFDDASAFLKLSGKKLEPGDRSILSAYKKECGSLYCRHACGICEPQCPNKVPINTIMRYDHYFASQGREKHVMIKYAALKSAGADKCQNCPGYCESACPYGVPVQALLATAHETLSLKNRLG